MTATREEVDGWISTARKNGDEYIISVCDTFDWEDYPIFCEDAEMVNQRIPDVDVKNMQRINEIIKVPKDGAAIENLNTLDF